MKKILWIIGFPLLLSLVSAGLWHGFTLFDAGGARAKAAGPAQPKPDKAAQAQWKRDRQPYTLVLLTVLNPDMGGRQYNSMPLAAELGIDGARSLTIVCRRLPYVMESILSALSRSGSEMLDPNGRFRVATQNENVRAAINRTLGKSHVRDVSLTLATPRATYKKPSLMCREGERDLSRFGEMISDLTK